MKPSVVDLDVNDRGAWFLLVPLRPGRRGILMVRRGMHLCTANSPDLNDLRGFLLVLTTW